MVVVVTFAIYEFTSPAIMLPPVAESHQLIGLPADASNVTSPGPHLSVEKTFGGEAGVMITPVTAMRVLVPQLLIACTKNVVVPVILVVYVGPVLSGAPPVELAYHSSVAAVDDA